MEVLYHLLRLTLGILCLAVARRTRHWYFACSGIALLIPAAVYDPLYWRIIWLPVETVRLLLAIGLSISTVMEDCLMIYDRERDMMLACGTTVGVSICLAGWLWMPENWFQAMVTIREYAYVTLVGITVFSWIWLRWIRPIPVALMMPAWCWWVIFSALMAAGGMGGLIWTVLPMKREIWYAIGDIGLAGQALVAVVLLMSLHPREA